MSSRIGVPGITTPSGVSAQAISLPTAEGSVQGMGESFSPRLSSGDATFAFPIKIAPGRAGVAPSFGLSYTSTGGNGPVGIGWALGAPAISRQTDRGTPRYVDRPTWHPEEDRFVLSGSGELVPVDAGAMAIVDASGLGYATGLRPADVPSNWQEYRSGVEGSFNRYFRAPDSSRWIVLAKNGGRMDFGPLAPSEGPSDLRDQNALLADPSDASRVFAWYLTRTSDAAGSSIYYEYERDRGDVYLTHAYYVSPHACGREGNADQQRACAEPLSAYGAHVQFDYECGMADRASCRADRLTSYVSGFRVETAWRLSRITVTAYEPALGSRALVRRYHLAYDPTSFHSLLSSIRYEGRPEIADGATGVNVFAHVPEAALTPSVVGVTHPATTFTYSKPPQTGPQVVGFGGVNASVHAVPGSPAFGLDAARTDLFDINGDGLPDFVVTDPARYRTEDGQPAVGVFFNGFSGPSARPAGRAAIFGAPIAVPMEVSLSNQLNLDSYNITPMDVDGDGRGDLMHLPRLDSYGWFTPVRTNPRSTVLPGQQGWRFAYAHVQLPSTDPDPRIDFARDPTHFKAFDVNNDHLVDIVRTTGTAMETWLNLGWIEGGEGRFGSAQHGASGWSLSTAPIESCLLIDGITPVDFADAGVRLGDMNGDGIQDIVRIRLGRVVYWPGRGGAAWGDGASTCSRNQGAGREVIFANPPTDIDANLNGVHLTDVNHDGLDDIAQVRHNQLDVWFNRAGAGWTSRITVSTPFASQFQSRVRWTDLDGSGTTDLVYGNAGNWQFLDLLGGQRPRILVGVDNGFGGSTTMTYGVSTEDYLRDLASAASADSECTTANCTTFTWDHLRTESCDAILEERTTFHECLYRPGASPVAMSVVRAVTLDDHFDQVGRERNQGRREFAYHDAYYEGIEQEFRGFGAADTTTIGDAYTPTSITRTWFEQGRRPNEIAADRLAQNPFDSLKGRTRMTEAFDAHGVYHSTSHTSFTVRRLAVGLDGRNIAFAFESASDLFRYDVSVPAGTGLTTSLESVHWENVATNGGLPTPHDVTETDIRIRNGRYAWIHSSTDLVDNVGNTLERTAHGRWHDEADAPTSQPSPYPEAVTHHTEFTLLGDECGATASWTWRPTASHITGHGTDARLEERTTSFDCRGNVVRGDAVARTDTTFDFGALGVTPSEQILTESAEYDAWGQTVRTCLGADISTGGSAAACLRYSEVARDGEHDMAVMREATGVDASDGEHCARSTPMCMVESRADWDRGTGALLEARDPNAQSTRVGYDGFGRLVFVLPPPSANCASSIPPTTIHYDVRPAGAPITVIESRIDARSADCSEPNVTVNRAFVDGFGRVRASIGTDDDGDGWIKSGGERLTAKGTAACMHRSVALDVTNPTPSQALSVATSAPVCVYSDAFGRPVERVDLRDTRSPRERMVHHALSREAWDSTDLGQHLQGRYHLADTPSFVRIDGHGRVIDQVLVLRRPGETSKRYMRMVTRYRADGAPLFATRMETADGARFNGQVVAGRSLSRAFFYDSLGRKLAATDADTDAPSSVGEGRRHWRYLYGRGGNLAAVRDPRGCGQDFFYDRAGRLIGERYATCEEAQESGELSPDSVPAGSIGLDVESSPQLVHARTYFDALPDWSPSFTSATTPIPTNGFWIGRASGVSDRGQRSLVAYDARGLGVWGARQMALIPEAAANVPGIWSEGAGTFDNEEAPTSTRVYDTVHTYTTTSTYDNLGRERAAILPADPDGVVYGGGTGAPQIRSLYDYTRRGLAKRVAAEIGGIEHDVLASASYTPDGFPVVLQWGASGAATESFQYDARLLITRHRVDLAAQPTEEGALAVAPGVTRPVDDITEWDIAGNLVSITDAAGPSLLPSGHRQSRRAIQHDSLGRVVNVDFEYRQSSGGSAPVWGAGDGATNPRDERTRETTQGGSHLSSDPMHREPAPMLASMPESRVVNLTYDYDWLANTVEWSDDASSFFERSIGAIDNGVDYTGHRPSALYFASDLPTMPSSELDANLDRGGFVAVEYGVSGNVVGLTAHAQCRDRVVTSSETLSCHVSAAAATPAAKAASALEGCTCLAEQHYEYRWDELNRLAEARRYDRGSSSGDFALASRQRYRYDGANMRTIKQTIDTEQVGSDLQERVQLYVSPGQFEVAGMAIDRDHGRYETSILLGTETQYSIGGARVSFRTGPANALTYDDTHRMTFAFSNLVSTTGAVVDLVSGELTEMMTFYPNGQLETHLTSEAKPTHLEPTRFTGKEADEEVGVVYFGERYLIPQIGRWASPDPLAIHALGGGEPMNSYHYVAGNLLATRDPNGLQAADSSGGEVVIPEGSIPGADDMGVRACINFRTGEACDEPDPIFDERFNHESGHGGATGLLSLPSDTRRQIANIQNGLLDFIDGIGEGFMGQDRPATFGFEFEHDVGRLTGAVGGLLLDALGLMTAFQGMQGGAAMVSTLTPVGVVGGAVVIVASGALAGLASYGVGVHMGSGVDALNDLSRNYQDGPRSGPRSSSSSSGGSGRGLEGGNWEFRPGRDVDMRGGPTYREALDEAFRRTGVPRDQFRPTRWGRDANGKSIPVEYRASNGAQVNLDIPSLNNRNPNGTLGNGPHQPHIGYQTPGKGSARVRGHIFVDDVPATR